MNHRRFSDYIEQVVGPIRACDARKDRMREELAAHLAASWQEERDRSGDECDASERAIRRMGEIGELSRSLQESAPRLERWLCTPVPPLSWVDVVDGRMSPRTGETPLRHAVRVTVGLTAAIAATQLIVVPVATAIHARPRTDWATTLLWAGASLVVTAAGAFLLTLIGSAMIRDLRGGRRLRIASYSVLSSALVVGLGMSFALIVSIDSRHGYPFARSDWPRLLAASLLAPPLLLFAARAFIARQRRRDPWGLDELAR
jgi:hypothetical protein